MSIEKTVSRPVSNWAKGDGPESDIVISSRIRLARNISGYAFPHTMSNQAADEILNAVRLAVDNDEVRQEFGPLEFVRLEELSPVERQILLEKHLISPQLLEDIKNRAVILSEDESLSIMINEEDHLRIQLFLPGLQLEEAWQKANRVDDLLEKTLDYAFCEQRGYLTACPTNVGTGLRASVMLHLPALVIAGQINNIITAISQLGLAVRGYYGEGTKAVGHLFQISNQITLGQAEEEIIRNLLTVARQIINQERSARAALYKNNKSQLEDKIFRSLGILSYSRMITTEEALTMLSDVRLGIALGILDNLTQRDINELMMLIRPAFLQKMAAREMTAQERDTERARIIRLRMEKLKK
ncbi:protein arginine kinase [Thermincola potens]|uniref:Protein-arginine kinase n=1 Tax=Thermincola potens (strain JR) TaxID=635013 RepID=D5X9Q9_THEPJ|nr:protein arginine kinase [Thermincola potens]ADG81130.1 ATP:guanido phosphotransferase [Thermincola potens JR]